MDPAEGRTRSLRIKKNPLRLGVLLSGGGTTLQNILERIEEKSLNAVVCVVVSSNSRAYGLVRAAKHLIPSFVVRLKDHENTDSFSEEITGVLGRFSVDLVLMAGFLRLYRIPETYEGRVMNIHPALIPKHCGKGFHGHHVHESVVAAGDTESGCTVHFADNEYDHGPIILQRKVAIAPEDGPDEVAAKVFAEECKAYPEAIRMYMENM